MTDTRRVKHGVLILSPTSGTPTEVKNNNNNDNNNNNNLGRKLAVQSGNDREISFLFQRLSVLVQQYNTILLHDCFVKEE